LVLDFQGNGKIQLVIQPVHILHPVHRFQAGLVLQGLRDGDVFHHDTGVGDRFIIDLVH
jgi:hypothetical protein